MDSFLSMTHLTFLLSLQNFISTPQPGCSVIYSVKLNSSIETKIYNFSIIHIIHICTSNNLIGI